MFILGITGGIGSGKSTLSQILAERGLPVIDADQLSHEVTAPGGSALPALVEVFGETILDEKGGLDRQQTAELVFKNRPALDQLSALIHREVFARIETSLQAFRQAKQKAVVLDVPLPIREGFLDRCHLILVVQADEGTRLRRLEQRGIAPVDAKRRMQMQLQPEEYARIGDHVLCNDGSKEALAKQVDELLQPIFRARGIPYAIPSSGEGKRDDSAFQRGGESL